VKSQDESLFPKEVLGEEGLFFVGVLVLRGENAVVVPRRVGYAPIPYFYGKKMMELVRSRKTDWQTQNRKSIRYKKKKIKAPKIFYS
jgi:hypothetical protein